MDPTEDPTEQQQPPDPMVEIKAMTAVAEALKGLSPQPLERVLEWANKHFLGRAAPKAKPAAGTNVVVANDDAVGGGDQEHVDFPTLLSSARHSTRVDRALLAGYYHQVVLGQTDFDGFSLNRELKNAGHASGNITRDLDGLIAKTPQLVIQTRKHGVSKQARKQYRLTTAGVAAAKAMMTAAGATE